MLPGFHRRVWHEVHEAQRGGNLSAVDRDVSRRDAGRGHYNSYLLRGATTAPAATESGQKATTQPRNQDTSRHKLLQLELPVYQKSRNSGNRMRAMGGNDVYFIEWEMAQQV